MRQHRQGGGQQAHDPFDIFARFFGGGGFGGFGGGGAGGDRRRRGPDMEVRVQLPLRDFYTGADTEIEVERQALCDECDGTGSADGHMDTCGQCGGSGVVVQRHMIALGVFQQVQTVCGVCGGRGRLVRTPCGACGGAKVVRRRVAHPLHVEPGMPRGARLRYEGEADEDADHAPGDLFVLLDEAAPDAVQAEVRAKRKKKKKEESKAADDDYDEEEEGADAALTDGAYFRRKGHDLYWTEVLGLREAWMGGWTRSLTHLDGHEVRLGRRRGHVVQPGTVDVLPGEGMPIWDERTGGGGAAQFGALHVEYVVVLPDRMERRMRDEFAALWDKWVPPKGAKAKDGAAVKDGGKEKKNGGDDDDDEEGAHDALRNHFVMYLRCFTTLFSFFPLLMSLFTSR